MQLNMILAQSHSFYFDFIDFSFTESFTYYVDVISMVPRYV